MKNYHKNLHFSALVALFIAFAISACEKQDPAVSDELSDETSLTENVYAQLDADVEDAMPYDVLNSGRVSSEGFGYGFGKCMTRTVERPDDATSFPKVVTISYDSTCSSGMHNTVKSGSIIITLTGHPSEVGSQRIVTFENFSVNGYTIEGTKTITFLGGNQWLSVLENGTVTTPEGKVFTRNAEHTRTQVAGMDTEERSDNVFEITGWAEGKTAEGYEYRKEIIEPLQVSRGCFWITKGVVETTIGEVVFSVDFGDGTCDDLAVKTIDGESEEIKLEMKVRKMWLHRLHHRLQKGK